MLYLGIDVSKQFHVAAFLSRDLLRTHKHYNKCPSKRFQNSRAGFEALLQEIARHGDPQECTALLERTGHYGAALESYLQEKGITLYRIHGKKRYQANKTDTLDAHALSVLLYNQVELHAPLVHERERLLLLQTESDESEVLRGLVRHYHELTRESARHRNKLTAIADELFPELTQVYTDPNALSALTMRQHFQTPQEIADATLDELRAARRWTFPKDEKLLELRELARSSIGIKKPFRLRSLKMEQRQLIRELLLLEEHRKELSDEIASLLASSRPGQILTSFPGVSTILAASLLAGIGSIDNFRDVQHFRSYLGWIPRQSQTGITMDSMHLHKGGNRLLKETLFLIGLSIVQRNGWKQRYERLVARKCSYDARTKQYTGRMKVIGTICGQVASILYLLLKRDARILREHPDNPPPPELYDASKIR